MPMTSTMPTTPTVPARPLVVAILMFDDMEVLDFAGPYEVFNVTAELNEPHAPLVVHTVAESTDTLIKARGQLRLQANFSFETLPQPNILIIPGGNGSRALLDKPRIIDWVKDQANKVDILASVCTGSLLLAKAGLLPGLSVTTHHTAIDSLREILVSATSHDTKIVAKRYVDEGKIVTSGGISAGIDMSLYLVRKLLGDEVLKNTTQEMEYTWTPDTSSPWQERVLAAVASP